MRAAIYCRVSTEDQEKEGSSLDTQREACLVKAEELGYEVPDDLNFTETYSGLTLDRPLLSKLRYRACNGDIQAIIVLKPDRLSRVGEDILLLAKEFKLNSMKLILVQEQWDDTLQGKLVAFMLGWAAEMYVSSTVEATRRAKKKLVENGIFPQGTGKGLYGYKWDKENKKRIPIEHEAETVKRIFTMLGGGISCFSVAKTLNEKGVLTKSGCKWHPRTIQRIATNMAYIGMTYFGKTSGSQKTKLVKQPEENWKLLPNATPAIINKELFDQVQKIREQDREFHRAKSKHDYLLRSHIKCGYCSRPLVGSFLKPHYRYYRCRGAYPTATSEKMCNASYIKADWIEGVVWEKVKEVLEKPQLILAELQQQIKEKNSHANDGMSLNKDIAKMKRRINTYDSEEKRLIKLFRHGEIDENSILDELNQLKNERKEDEAVLAQYNETKRQLDNLIDAEVKLNEYCERVKQNLANSSFEQKRLALDALSIQIMATPGQVDIKGIIPVDITAKQAIPEFSPTGQTSGC